MDPIQYPASLAPSYPSDDKRHAQWERERQERGFDSTELWNLDLTFAKMMLPRLLAYIDYVDDKVVHDDAWKADMAVIITMFELLGDDSKWFDENVQGKIDTGLKLFIQHIQGLWY